MLGPDLPLIVSWPHSVSSLRYVIDKVSQVSSLAAISPNYQLSQTTTNKSQSTEDAATVFFQILFLDRLSSMKPTA
jgi:hypothetical protein